MIKIVYVSLLMVMSIFFGIYPSSEGSPHSIILKYLGIKQTSGFAINIIIGILLYILALIIAHLNIPEGKNIFNNKNNQNVIPNTNTNTNANANANY